MAGSAMGAVVLALTTASVAQTSGSGTVQLNPIQVTGQGANENTSTVDGEQLRLEAGNRVDDLLRTLPGVFTRQNAQQPGVAVNIRGFEGAGRVNMSIDGVRQSFRFTSHEAAGFTYVDPALLAGIDVTRGAVVGVGGGALAGTANFRTLNVDDIVREGQTYGALARLGWGSNGVDFSEMAAAGARTEHVGVAAAISRRSSRNYQDGYGNSVSGTGQDLISGLGRLNFNLGEGHSLGLGMVLYDNDFYANSYYQTINNRTYTVNYRYNTGNPWFDISANAYYNDLTMKYTGGTGSSVGRTIEDEGTGFDISNVSRFSIGPVQVRSNNGVEYFHDSVTSNNGGVNPADGTSALLGVFTDTTFSYSIVDFTPGLRYNYYTLDGTGIPNSRYGTYTVDNSESSLDPRITLAIRPLDWLQPYVTWSRSMRAPTLQETMLGGTHPGTTSGAYIPNPALKPETQQGWEFGVNIRQNRLFTGNDTLRMRANYFIMDVDDYIVATYVPAYRSYQFQNVAGSSRVQGFEFETNYDARVAFGSINYTHTDSKLPSQMPGLGASQYTPDDVVAITGGGRLFDERLTLGARYTYVSGGLVAGYNSSVTGGVASEGGKPYNLFDLFASVRVTENLDLNARVTNLFDVAYTPFLSTTGTGQGRTIYFGLQARL
ncbi:TonB-dependent receptor [Roseomonas eburnea]|uniref:TonB-dependent receptor n=1 Tax=Neoroseomonas eburnea TaxID=1346889 RepID=A0A9X9XHY8_9PROT|nr:TonB-dependent receptor [Neoroseomonas eburnea]MBR0683324.1 TonB-dependent receptor [Neoroseomonas eburnea]